MVYETLKRSLEPIGVYREDAEVSDRELQVFAEEIERLYTELDGMFRERFIGTARTSGCAYMRSFSVPPERAKAYRSAASCSCSE